MDNLRFLLKTWAPIPPLILLFGCAPIEDVPDTPSDTRQVANMMTLGCTPSMFISLYQIAAGGSNWYDDHRGDVCGNNFDDNQSLSACSFPPITLPAAPLPPQPTNLTPVGGYATQALPLRRRNECFMVNGHLGNHPPWYGGGSGWHYPYLLTVGAEDLRASSAARLSWGEYWRERFVAYESGPGLNVYDRRTSHLHHAGIWQQNSFGLWRDSFQFGGNHWVTNGSPNMNTTCSPSGTGGGTFMGYHSEEVLPIERYVLCQEDDTGQPGTQLLMRARPIANPDKWLNPRWQEYNPSAPALGDRIAALTGTPPNAVFACGALNRVGTGGENCVYNQ